MPPLRLSTTNDFRLVREFLRSSDFTAAAVCRLLNLGDLYELVSGSTPATPDDPRPLSLLVRLFVIGEGVERTAVESCIPAAVLAAMERLGLLTSENAPAGQVVSPVLMAPTAGLVLAADRYSNPDRSPYSPPADVVYPGLMKGTLTFLAHLPLTPCRRLLDLCSGTGVAALQAVQSGSADSAWAVDITARATHFCEFNRRLNSVENVTAAEGDLYESLGMLSFDRIIAHPPYVPSVEPKFVFLESVEGGEAVTRRIIAGLPKHLEPGGRLYCLTTGMDCKDMAYEDRVAAWLGPDRPRFDILLVELESYLPTALVSGLVYRGQISRGDGRQLRKQFAAQGARSFFHGIVVIQRRETPRPCFTVRRTAGPRTGSPEIEWLMRWLTATMDPKFRLRLLKERLTASASGELRMTQRFEDGELVTTSIGLQTDYPFNVECRVQPWAAQCLAACGRPQRGEEIYRYGRENGIVAEAVPKEEFTRFLEILVSQGFLETESFRTPGATE